MGVVGGGKKWLDLESISKVLLTRLTDGPAMESQRNLFFTTCNMVVILRLM